MSTETKRLEVLSCSTWYEKLFRSIPSDGSGVWYDLRAHSGYTADRMEICGGFFPSGCENGVESLLSRWAWAAVVSPQLWLCPGSAPSTRERRRASGRWEKATAWAERPGLSSRSNSASWSTPDKTRDAFYFCDVLFIRCSLSISWCTWRWNV